MLVRVWNQVEFHVFAEINSRDFDGVVEQRDLSIAIDHSGLAQAEGVLGGRVGLGQGERAKEAIALLLGSHRVYIQEFEAVPGTYYLSKGWLESGSHPLKEHREYAEKYGPEEADWLMDQQYQHYERLAMVAHTREDLDKYRPEAEEVARYCERWGFRYEEILGSDTYVRRLIEVAATLDQADGDFVVVPPGGEIKQIQFMR